MKFKEAMYKSAPYIAFGCGVIGFVGAIASAIKNTTKLDYILDEHNLAIDELNGRFITDEGEVVDDKEKQKALVKGTRKIYLKTAGRMAWNYKSTIAFMLLGMTGFGVSFGMVRKRLVVTSAALTGVTETLETYRKRVIEDLGADKDMEYMYGVKKEKVEVEETDEETGKVKKTKKELLVGKINGPFTYRFEQYDYRNETGSKEWNKDPNMNWCTITQRIKHYQERILDQGKAVHLYDILDELGFEHETTYKEAIAGWLPGDKIFCGIESNDPSRVLTKDAYDFIVGNSPDVTLMFNCRPDIYGVVVLETELGANDADTDLLPLDNPLTEAEKEYLENDVKAIKEALNE